MNKTNIFNRSLWFIGFQFGKSSKTLIVNVPTCDSVRELFYGCNVLARSSNVIIIECKYSHPTMIAQARMADLPWLTHNWDINQRRTPVASLFHTEPDTKTRECPSHLKLLFRPCQYKFYLWFSLHRLAEYIFFNPLFFTSISILNCFILVSSFTQSIHL
jgi:hypothetical protein